MKRLALIIFTLIIIASLTACGNCEHTYDNACDTSCNECKAIREVAAHDFAAADCDTPKTCTVCGATEGEANGHDWLDPDCDTPKTCDTCGATEGEANGHDWLDPDCDTPKTCDTCGATEGEANGHDWLNATCETPKTCDTCGATEGEANGHDWLNATCDTPKTCDTCGATEGEVSDHTYASEYTITTDGHYYECTCHPELNELIPHENNDGDTVCDDCGYVMLIDYTITLDGGYEDVKITLTDDVGEEITAVTNENGQAIFTILKGNYTLNVEHYNSAFIWNDSETPVVLTPENNTYTAMFTVSDGFAEHVIYLYRPDGSIAIGADILTYSLSGKNIGYHATNSRGMAVLNIYNDDYVVSIHYEGMYYYTEFKKDGPTTLHVTLSEDTAPMTEKTPMLIYDLCDLPYLDEDIAGLPIDNSYDFEANESIYLLLPYARGKVLTLGTDKLVAECNGTVLAPNESGEIIFDVLPGESVVIKLTATEAATESFEINTPGSPDSPYYLTTEDMAGEAMKYTLYAGESIYFEFYGEELFEYVVEVKNATVTINNVEMTVIQPKYEYVTVCITAIEDGEVEVSMSYYEIMLV